MASRPPPLTRPDMVNLIYRQFVKRPARTTHPQVMLICVVSVGGDSGGARVRTISRKLIRT
jgi:hypothetical protein